MKNRYFILSVLFWAIASVCMAVTLPSSSFTVYSGSEDTELGFVSDRGISFLGTGQTSNYDGPCQYADWKGDSSGCVKCCEESFTCATTDYDCWFQRGLCIDQCGDPLGGLPLGSPLLLLPFALVYAFVRKRKEATL